jgi:Recombinase/Resolvase, N terminal domain
VSALVASPTEQDRVQALQRTLYRAAKADPGRRFHALLSRLLELARLTDTLVVDADGVYDLSDINDRLLLGLKGQMSEAELHLLTSRLQESKRAAARRGELRVPLPVGYVYDDEGAVVIDPDAEVAAAVTDVFASFAATGSAYGVAGAFAGRRFPRRAYGGVWAGQIRWGRLTHARAAEILTNPVYAGAYVFGRRRTRQVVHPDGSVHSSTTELQREQWQVLIHDHHEGYVDWEQFLAIEARLAANHQRRRPPASGGDGAVPGHRVLRRLRSVDAGALRRPTALLRVLPFPRRPRGDTVVRFSTRRHRR